MSKLRNSMMVTGWWCAGISAANAAAATGYMTPQSAALGGIAAIAVVATVISRRNLRLAREEHAAVVHQASHDTLTELPNRLAFMRGLSHMLRDDGQAAVIFLDLDGFKAVNDSFGHDVGDAFLKNSAARLRAAAGQDRLIARVGGDEFAIAVCGHNARQMACKIAGNITEIMKTPIDHEGRELFAGASLGIACGHRDDVTPEELLKRADMAMYEAKRIGGSTWEMFDSRLAASRNRCEALFSAIRQAVDAATPLPLLYEPVTRADNAELAAARAVLKWPDVAEDVSGLMGLAAREGFGSDLLHHVLERACADARKFPAMRLCVPATAQQLLAPDFEHRIETAFIRHGVDPSRIDFQFQATQLPTLGKRLCAQLMQRLATRGVQFSLTGFGDGPSDISLLAQSPFKRLVLHESLSTRIGHDVTAQQVIQGISAIARAHGIEVGAEGVSNASQAKLLRLAGVTELSGTHAGAACSPAQLMRHLMRLATARAISA
jgi:diguanylate cyclase (GGDEF)-like protein